MFSERIEQFDINQPIFTEDILSAFSRYSRAYVFRIIKKWESTGELVRFSQGIYYRPKKTFYGMSTITADDVIEKKYLRSNEDVYGIRSGLWLLNKFLITPQVPNVIEIVTNKETMRCREIDIDGRKFILRKSRVDINKENEKIYILLQLFNDLGTKNTIDNVSKQLIIKYIADNKINKKQLFDMAMSFPAIVTKNMIRTGVLNGII